MYLMKSAKSSKHIVQKQVASFNVFFSFLFAWFIYCRVPLFKHKSHFMQLVSTNQQNKHHVQLPGFRDPNWSLKKWRSLIFHPSKSDFQTLSTPSGSARVTTGRTWWYLSWLLVGRLCVPVGNSKGSEKILTNSKQRNSNTPENGAKGLRLALHGRSEAFELYEEMPKMQVNPNIIHLNALLNAYETLGSTTCNFLCLFVFNCSLCWVFWRGKECVLFWFRPFKMFK